VILGKSVKVHLAETDFLEKIVKQLKWVDKTRELRGQLALEEANQLIKTGIELALLTVTSRSSSTRARDRPENSGKRR
jgi:hypothetical protein